MHQSTLTPPLPRNKAVKKMKPILVHTHIFYSKIWADLRDCLNNIAPIPYDLYITMVENHKDIVDDIRNNFPLARIEIVENRGYDVGPFIHILNKINLDNYSYVIKLHTKRDVEAIDYINIFDLAGPLWRKYALNFLASSDNFKLCLEAFEKHVRLGMVSDHHLIVKSDPYKSLKVFEIKKLFKKVNLTMKKFSFVMGTMFMVRAELLKPLCDLKLDINSFEIITPVKKVSLEHILERFFGCLVSAQGYEIADCVTPINIQYREFFYRFLRKTKDAFYSLLRRIKDFFYRVKINKKGRKIVKICKIQLPYFLFKGLIK